MAIPGSTTYPGATTFPGVGSSVSMVPAVNPNWPLVGIEVDFTQGPPNLPGVNRLSINAAYRKLGVRQMSISRGRQYELDFCQAGTATVSVLDPNEYLNPDNASSPFNTGGNSILSYRPIRILATWPTQPGSGNILAGNGINVDVSFENNTTGGWVTQGGTTAVVSTIQAFSGAHSLLVTQPGPGFSFGVSQRFSLIPGVTYIFSCYIFLSTATSVSIQVTKADAATVSSTAVTGTGWTRASVSWTSVDTMETVAIANTGAGSTFYLDAVQLEFGSTASAFTTSGPTTYNLFTGYVERFPTSYEMGGTRALRPLVAVDALAVLSRTVINQSYLNTIAVDNPTLYIPYNDTAAANLVLRQATAVTTSNLASVVAVRGIQDISSGGTAEWGGDTTLDGTPALTLSLQNFSGASSPTQYMAADIPHTFSYPVSTAAASFEGWLKWTAGHFHGLFFGYNPGNTGILYNETWSSTSDSFAGLVFTTDGIQFYVNTAGKTATASLFTPAGSSGSFALNDATAFTGDGQWHYYAMVLRPNASNNGWVLDLQIDTHVTTATPSPAATGYDTFQFNQIMNEVLLTYGDTLSKISVANLAYYSTILTTTQRINHYNRGIGYLGELSGARVSRLLTAYWNSTGISVAPGQLAMAADFGYAPLGQQPRAVLDVAQEIQESERGLIYVDKNGTVVFEDRTSRSTTTPSWVLGENPAGASPAEYPYSDYQADFDPTYTFSQCNLTRPGNSNFPAQVNTTTQSKYGQRVLSQEVQCVDDYALSQAATFYLNRYANPKTRLSKITLNPAGNPNLWPVALGLEISQQNTITRRSSGTTVSNGYFVEKIDYRIDAQNFTWTADIQVSPVFTTPSKVWVLGTGILGTSTVPTY